jgi:hypothetical protein
MRARPVPLPSARRIVEAGDLCDRYRISGGAFGEGEDSGALVGDQQISSPVESEREGPA